MRAQGVALAEQFIDVSLTVADMHAAAGVAEVCRRLPHILQPTDTFFFLDGNTRGVDCVLAAINAFTLERVGSLEFLPRPELNCPEPQRQAFGGSRPGSNA